MQPNATCHQPRKPGRMYLTPSIYQKVCMLLHSMKWTFGLFFGSSVSYSLPSASVPRPGIPRQKSSSQQRTQQPHNSHDVSRFVYPNFEPGFWLGLGLLIRFLPHVWKIKLFRRAFPFGFFSVGSGTVNPEVIWSCLPFLAWSWLRRGSNRRQREKTWKLDLIWYFFGLPFTFTLFQHLIFVNAVVYYPLYFSFLPHPIHSVFGSFCKNTLFKTLKKVEERRLP